MTTVAPGGRSARRLNADASATAVAAAGAEAATLVYHQSMGRSETRLREFVFAYRRVCDENAD